MKAVLSFTDTLRDFCYAVPIPPNTITGLNKDMVDILADNPIAEFVKREKNYISGALAALLDLGQGSGPIDHAFVLNQKSV